MKLIEKEIQRLWNALFSAGEIIELRAPDAGRYKTLSGYFDSPLTLAQEAAKWDGEYSLYFVLNPVSPALLSRCANTVQSYAKNTTNDKEIPRLRRLLIDLDAERPTGISATDSEHEAAISRAKELRAFLWEHHEADTLLADSGNGGHAILPLDLENTPGNVALLKRVLAGLAFHFDGDGVHVDQTTFNPSRLCKLYGSVAMKGSNTPDRPHRRACLLEVPETFTPVSRETLERMAALLPEPEEEAQPVKAGLFVSGGFDLSEFLSRHNIKVFRQTPYDGGTRYQLEACPFNPAHGRKDAAIFQRADGRLGFRCLHNSCRGNDWKALRSWLEPEYAQRRQREEGQAVSGQKDIGQPVNVAMAWEPLVPLNAYSLPPFPVDALPVWLAEFVTAEAATTQTPTDLAGMLCLSACALAVAKKARIAAGSHWYESLNLFTVTAMPPGSRKSAVFGVVIEPIEQYEQEANEKLAPEIAQTQTDRDILAARLEKEKKKAVNAPNAADRLVIESEVKALARELEGFRLPSLLRLVADDCTPERVAGLLMEQGGKLAILSPEGGVFDQIAGRYSDSGPNMDVYLKGHAGDTLRVDRVHRAPEYVPSPALTLGLAVQPDVLRGLGSKAGIRGRGLLGRLLYSLPESNLGYRSTDAPPMLERVARDYAQGVQKLLLLEAQQTSEGKPEPYLLLMEASTMSLFNQYRAEVERMLRPGEELGHMTDWGGKLCGAVARVAGILHLAEYADPSCKISPKTLESAIRLGRYFTPHAKAAYGELGMDADTDHARAILAWIQRKEIVEFSKREVHNGLQSRFQRASELERPLEILLERNYLRERVAEDRASQQDLPVYLESLRTLHQDWEKAQTSP